MMSRGARFWIGINEVLLVNMSFNRGGSEGVTEMILSRSLLYETKVAFARERAI